jgi:two-component system chemotaxis sensor kinase CheA
MDDLLRDFLTESNENLAQLEQNVVALEQRPHDVHLVHRIFRTIHTIKGTCACIGLARLEAVAHAAESVLGLVRAEKLAVTAPLISDVLAAVDVIRCILDELERSAVEPAGDDTALIARLDAWVSGDLGTAPVATVTPVDQHVAGESAATAVTGETKRPVPVAATGDATLRVSVKLLDRLTNVVGELVFVRNQLLHLSAAQGESPFAKSIQRLDRVTADLQDAVMKTRMQPLTSAWAKLPRLVRDLAQATGKQVKLTMTGAETELDRQIQQAMQDPLMHMIRNSVDHGIESPAARKAAGKPETGTLQLSACQEGGYVILEVADDGAGIDVARIRKKAVERGLVKAEIAARMSDASVHKLVFVPGFSTAECVTSMSGRGVGMDVVRRNVERMGGTVELSSTVGVGTTVRIKIPLTLTIRAALLVKAAGEVFAIPQAAVVELVHAADRDGSVEHVDGARYLRRSDARLSLVCLSKMLALSASEGAANRPIVVCQVGEVRLGLEVDDVLDTQEIVVQSTGRIVTSLPPYSGCAVLEDGRVIMLLDPSGIARQAGITAEAGWRRAVPTPAGARIGTHVRRYHETSDALPSSALTT